MAPVAAEDCRPDHWSVAGRWPGVIIGGGPAGLAVASRTAGALIIEAEPHLGGRILSAAALSWLVGTPEQEAAGFFDSPEQAAKDWPALTGSEPTETTLRFLDDQGALRDELVSMGLSLQPPSADPILRLPRIHGLEGGGIALARALEDSLQPDTELRLGLRAGRVVSCQRRVVGVMAAGQMFGADEVVVASGGYASNAELIPTPSEAQGDSWRAATTEGADGQAVLWAQGAGWGLADLDHMGWQRDLSALQAEDGSLLGYAGLGSFGGVTPLIWVNEAGERFTDEAGTHSLALSTPYRAHAPVRAIITWEHLRALLGPDSAHLLEQALDAEERAWCASGSEELASKAGIAAGGLQQTLATVASIRAGELEDAHGRHRSTLPDLSAAELCAFVPGQVANKTFGGLAVDQDGRVLDEQGLVVEGLWAVGEAAGMAAPGMGGRSGFDGSISAVLWSGWRTGDALVADQGP